MYAEERKKPTPPWKPNTVEDAELEKIRAQKAKVAEELAAKNKTNDQDELDANAVSSEFNLLAELIVAPPGDDDNFRPVLFPEWLDAKTSGAPKEFEDNTIHIDLGT